jgi:hypothetical protein
MWMSAEKRRVLAKETANLPYLKGTSKQEEESATIIRGEILETVFDQFIRPDDPDSDPSAPSRWNRARQLWKSLLAEERAAYFVELRDSDYLDWIKTGTPTVLPCTTEEIESRNKNLPELKGPTDVVQFARHVRASLLKSSDAIEQLLLESGAQAARRLMLRHVRDVLRKITDPEWFIRRQPKVFAKYKELLSSWLESKITDQVKKDG